MEISQEEFIKRAEKLYGKNTADWKFKCTSSQCGKVQSAKTIGEQMKDGTPSKRHGLLKKGDNVHPECECYSPDCDWTAYGLLRSGILVIIDPTKPHNKDRVENCYWIFPLADDEEMLKAAGLTSPT